MMQRLPFQIPATTTAYEVESNLFGQVPREIRNLNPKPLLWPDPKDQPKGYVDVVTTCEVLNPYSVPLWNVRIGLDFKFWESGDDMSKPAIETNHQMLLIGLIGANDKINVIFVNPTKLEALCYLPYKIKLLKDGQEVETELKVLGQFPINQIRQIILPPSHIKIPPHGKANKEK
jgi:hypothetical protein